MEIETTRSQSVEDNYPEFLVKTTFGCSIVIFIILAPFTINNFIQGRFTLGLATSIIAILDSINIWNGFRGRYSLFANTYVITPFGTLVITYVLFKLAVVGSYWPLLLVPAYYFILPEKRAGIYNVLTVIITIPLAWSVLNTSLAVRFSAVMIGVSLSAIISMHEIYALHGLLKKQAATDNLTGLLNRSLLERTLRQAISQNDRTGIPVALLCLDIDRFKTVNDTMGHDIGDMALKKLGNLLRQRTRKSDMIFRVGGDEFIVLLHNSDEQQSASAAEALRLQIEESDLIPDYRVTVSIGVSGLFKGMNPDSWVKACDQKLYIAKEGGRNKVIV